MRGAAPRPSDRLRWLSVPCLSGAVCETATDTAHGAWVHPGGPRHRRLDGDLLARPRTLRREPVGAAVPAHRGARRGGQRHRAGHSRRGPRFLRLGFLLPAALPHAPGPRCQGLARSGRLPGRGRRHGDPDRTPARTRGAGGGARARGGAAEPPQRQPRLADDDPVDGRDGAARDRRVARRRLGHALRRRRQRTTQLLCVASF